MQDVEVVSRETPFKGFFSVERVKVRFRLQSGEMSPIVERTSVNRGDAAVALVRNIATDRYVLVSQFRYACFANGEPAWLLETVAGSIDSGESPEDAARRETLEEIRLRVTSIEPVGVCYASPGTSTERYYLFLAEGEPTESAAYHDPHIEDLELIEFSADDLREMVRAGKIRDAKTILCILSLKA